jgi:HAD superfamily hydrolase (TIGR01549 family)
MKLFRKKPSNGKQSPTWYYRVTYNGKIIQRSTGCAGKKDAEAFYKNTVAKMKTCGKESAVADAMARTPAERKNMRLKDAWEEFLKMPSERSAAEKQDRYKRSILQDFLAYLADNHPAIKYLHEATLPIGQQYMQQLRTQGRWEKDIIQQSKKTSNEYAAYSSTDYDTLNDFLSKNYTLVLYTDCYQSQINPTLEILQIKDFFAPIISKEDGFKKPNSKAYQYIADRLRLDLDEMLLIATDQENDLAPFAQLCG